MLAETNAATLNGYKEKGGVKKHHHHLPALLQHAFQNEYPGLSAPSSRSSTTRTSCLELARGRRSFVPSKPVRAKVAYHDSCYLGRYNDIYESPREILRGIPGIELVEVEGARASKKGLCCGAGGAQMFMEEQNNNRVNVKRTLQLLDTGAHHHRQRLSVLYDHAHGRHQIAVQRRSKFKNMDVVEMLAISCGVSDGPGDAGSGDSTGSLTAKPALTAAE